MRWVVTLAVLLGLASGVDAQVAVRAGTLHTMAGQAITDGVVLIGADGRIEAVGPASTVNVPSGYRTITGVVATPGLIDARGTIGLSGWLNQNHDQDQLERSEAIQPELRAIDAYNPREPLVRWARSYGVTTIHTGHAPGALISGQTLVAKTRGDTVEEAVIKPQGMIVATISDRARGQGDKSPGTRAKMAAMLRQALLEAQQYADKLAAAGSDDKPARDLRNEALASALAGEVPIAITAHRAHDILTAIPYCRRVWLSTGVGRCGGGVRSTRGDSCIRSACVGPRDDVSFRRGNGESHHGERREDSRRGDPVRHPKRV